MTGWWNEKDCRNGRSGACRVLTGPCGKKLNEIRKFIVVIGWVGKDWVKNLLRNDELG